MKFWINDFIHNAIIHPIMAFIPAEMGDKLHDWHAKKFLEEPDQ